MAYRIMGPSEGRPAATRWATAGAAQAAWDALDVIEAYVRDTGFSRCATQAACLTVQLRAALRDIEQEEGRLDG